MVLKRRFHNKSGQFFLVAAIIIIVVLVSVITVSNYTSKKDVVKLYDLGEELGIESQQVLDYGTYSGLSESEMQTLMENFIKNYVSYIEQDKNIYFIFGNKNKINVMGYQEIVEEDVCVSLNPLIKQCGNSLVSPEEECDDGNVEDGDGCSSECALEISSGELCENDILDSGEFCDGAELDGKTCQLLGFESGQLTCSDCSFDVSNCARREEEPCTPYNLIGESQPFYETGEEINNVVIKIGDVYYEFSLKQGENFYFVIWQYIGGETYVVTSEGE